MKNYEVTYTKGHLVDVKNGKRIFLKRGGRFLISGDDNQFEEKDDLSIEKQALDAVAKLKKIQDDHKGCFFEQIAMAGTELFYRIGLSRKTGEDRQHEFLFQASLLEDLYMYSKNGSKWRLCNCLCETGYCLEGEVQMIEPVRGLSLNNLFSNLVAFYFPLQRSGACNAFNEFYFPDPDLKPDLGSIKNKRLRSISTTREIIIGRYSGR